MQNLLIILIFSSLGLSALAQDSLLEEKKLASEYLAKMSTESGAQVLDQGVVLRSLYQATSENKPNPTDLVTVVYQGYDREGKDFDNSFVEETSVTFPLNKLIRCWQIAMVKMPVGSFFKVTCPSDTAYGDKGIDGVIKPGAAISFRIMLLKTEAAPKENE